MLPTIHSTIMATIGLRSSGPNGGMKRRKIDRYGLGDVAQEVQDRVATSASTGAGRRTLKHIDEKM